MRTRWDPSRYVAFVRTKRPRSWRRRIKVILLALVVVAVLFAQTGPGQAALRATGLARPTQPFSELYFLHPAELPLASPVVHPLQIEFVIHRDSGAAAYYRWRIDQTIGKDARSLARGSVVVPANESVLITATVQVTCARIRRTRLGIALLGTSIHIDEWVKCQPRR